MCGSGLKNLLPLPAPPPFSGSLSALMRRGASTSEISIAPGRPIIDAHVHIFPQKLMDAVWKFFESYYWPVKYKEDYREGGAEFLIEKGIQHVVLLQYAHKDGISRGLNKYMGEYVKQINEKYGRKVATGLATCMPGETGATDILREAFEVYGLEGIKMHSHVQDCAANDKKMDEIYEICARFNKPVILHSGREPNSPAYKSDTHSICSFKFIVDVLSRHPNLRLVIPHMGWDETRDYIDLLEHFPNLYLDTTMMLSGFFPSSPQDPTVNELKGWIEKFSERILYGSDWPNVPYDWWAELNNLGKYELKEEVLERILWRNAAEIYNIREGILLAGATPNL